MPGGEGGEGQLCDSAAEILRDQFEYEMECLQIYVMLLRVSNSLRSRQQEPFIAQIKFTRVGLKSLAYWIRPGSDFRGLVFPVNIS